MIRTLELENVRMFVGEGWKLALRPLTILCGTNGSGKSTLLRMPLLLRQSHGVGEQYEVPQGTLRFVGRQVDFDSYTALVSHHDVTRPMSIGLTIETRIPAALHREIGSTDQPNTDIVYTLRTLFRFGAAPQPTSDQSSESLATLQHADYEVLVDNKQLLCWQIVPSTLGCQTDTTHHLYDMLIPKQDVEFLDELLMNKACINVEEDGSVRLRAKLHGLLPEAIFARPDQDAESPWIAVGVSPSYIRDVLFDLRLAFSNVHYLGPMRSLVKRYYIAEMDTLPDSDTTGEFLPYVLKDNSLSQAVVYDVPPGAHEPQETTLLLALNRWLYYLRTGTTPDETVDNEIVVSTTRDVLVEWQVRTSGGFELHAMADSGFGYAQMLPILVRGLLVKSGGTLIVEEPELHLYPALQVRLAEFFVAMIRAGKQVIIETHSEYIVNMVRVLVAEDTTGTLATLCGLFFLDTQTDSESPTIQDLSPHHDGYISELPAHFLGDAVNLQERLRVAYQQTRTQNDSSHEPLE